MPFKFKEIKNPSSGSVKQNANFSSSCSLKNLNTLERTFVSRRILLKKITIMPKGSFLKLKGLIYNIPIETTSIANTLPHGADSSGFVVVKLKRKLSFRGHVYFEPVCPESLYQALLYLKENNPFYRDISINMNNIPNELTDLSELDDNLLELDDNLPETETY